MPSGAAAFGVRGKVYAGWTGPVKHRLALRPRSCRAEKRLLNPRGSSHGTTAFWRHPVESSSGPVVSVRGSGCPTAIAVAGDDRAEIPPFVMEAGGRQLGYKREFFACR